MGLSRSRWPVACGGNVGIGQSGDKRKVLFPTIVACVKQEYVGGVFLQ
jgi:hypothetical protein